jgi:hypothetical protein
MVIIVNRSCYWVYLTMVIGWRKWVTISWCWVGNQGRWFHHLFGLVCQSQNLIFRWFLFSLILKMKMKIKGLICRSYFQCHAENNSFNIFIMFFFGTVVMFVYVCVFFALARFCYIFVWKVPTKYISIQRLKSMWSTRSDSE